MHRHRISGVIGNCVDVCPCLAGQGNVAVEKRLPFSRQVHDDDLMDCRDEGLPPVRRFAQPIGDRCNGSFEVKFTPVPCRAHSRRQGAPWKVDEQISEGLVRRHPKRHAHHRRVGQRLGFDRAALRKEPPGSRQSVACIRVRGIPRPTGPNALLVQLKSFACNATEHHRAKAAVPDGQRFHPRRRRFPVPEECLVRHLAAFPS